MWYTSWLLRFGDRDVLPPQHREGQELHFISRDFTVHDLLLGLEASACCACEVCPQPGAAWDTRKLPWLLEWLLAGTMLTEQ